MHCEASQLYFDCVSIEHRSLLYGRIRNSSKRFSVTLLPETENKKRGSKKWTLFCILFNLIAFHLSDGHGFCYLTSGETHGSLLSEELLYSKMWHYYTESGLVVYICLNKDDVLILLDGGFL